MPPILFDTSVYITLLRSGSRKVAEFGRQQRSKTLWLSGVVLEELYAGSKAGARKEVDRLYRSFRSVGRILIPNTTDWVRTGETLYRIGGKYGFENIKRSRLTNDTLISVNAARYGVTVITVNQRDFAKIAEFCPLSWQVLGF